MLVITKYFHRLFLGKVSRTLSVKKILAVLLRKKTFFAGGKSLSRKPLSSWRSRGFKCTSIKIISYSNCQISRMIIGYFFIFNLTNWRQHFLCRVCPLIDDSYCHKGWTIRLLMGKDGKISPKDIQQALQNIKTISGRQFKL